MLGFRLTARVKIITALVLGLISFILTIGCLMLVRRQLFQESLIQQP